MNVIRSLTLILFLSVCSFKGVAANSPLYQVSVADSILKVYSVDSLFILALENNQSLKISKTNHEIAEQQVKIVRSGRLPKVTASLTAGYLGDASVIEPDFSSSTKVRMPHFANSFGLDASQLIFKGNALNNSIASASLKEQIALLNSEEDILDIKMLVVSNYFDLYALHNQSKVYDSNLELAELRLDQIRKLYKEGMVTRNDVIRTELLISDLKLAQEVLRNNMAIVNKQLTMATGLPPEESILPDSTILAKKATLLTYQEYEWMAVQSYPSVRVAKLQSEIAKRNVRIAESGRLPSLSAYAGSNLTRPLSSSSPALDMYSHGWQVGLSLSFNIDALYKAPQEIKLNQQYLKQSHQLEVAEQQNRSVAVHAAYIRHKETISQWKTREQNRKLAIENYRIIERKYLNQLALAVDMLDASNAKLNAELEYTNAEIKILYTYYQLQKELGKL